jgi:outer membrane protein assembly factor BamD
MARLGLTLVLALGILAGCASSEKIDPNTAEGAYKLGLSYAEDERYEEAVAQFATVKNKFPYSRFATEAELKIADIQFEREFFIEAQNAYQIFKELHPRHPKSDYVTYQLAMSFFEQLPSTIDRDLSLADQAILYFEEVINSYSTSKYMKKARKKRKKCKQMLAEKILYIADFYFIRDIYDSALTRYEQLLREYPGIGFNDRALYGATMSADKVKDKKKREFYLSNLRENFPQIAMDSKSK